MEKNEGKKEIYFIILYQREEKERENEFAFIGSDTKPKNIYTKQIEGEEQSKTYLYGKIFKYDKGPKKEEENKIRIIEDKEKVDEIEINFEIGNDNYIISFNNEDKLFYYDIELRKGNKFIENIEKEIIDQNILDYYKKFELFFEAINKNKEEAKIYTLYNEAINLYSQKNGFYFLISLFAKIYNKQNLCVKLIKEFYLTNSEQRNDKNMDRKQSLIYYKAFFSDISYKADNLIEYNEYDFIQFYAIIFCYINYYDYENYKKLFKKLYNNKPEVLYEILLIYNSHLVNPIEQDLDFFVKFIEETISKKEFGIFENVFNYILDTEIFIVCLDKTKEKIIEKYKNDFEIIKIKANLKVKKREKGEEMNIIIPSIESIINFSKKKEILLIYFSGYFWNNILKHYEEPTPYCINICFRLREVFMRYNSLINILFKDKKEEEIKNDINKYLEEDKFASILDQSIMIIIQKDRKLSDSQILEYISYNPYYKEEKYKNKRTINLFDYIKLENINEEFITLFKSFNFEIIFDEIEFLNKMISKINNIFKFGVIINLIDINRLSNKDEYISQLKKKYEIASKKEIDSLKGEKLQEAATIISHFITILFILEKNCEFLESMIEKMNKIISCLIYNKLIIICQCDEYQPIREFIFKKYLNDNNANNIISLINSLPKEVKIKFLNELMEKCKFTSKEFYSNSESKKIKLLCKLNNEGILDKKICYEAIWDIKDILNNIHKDIENWNIKKQTLELFLKNEKDVVINRLALIKISIENYNPKVAYDKITKKFEEINYNIKDLTFMKDSLSIFHRQKYLKEINVIKKIIDRLENDAIKNYNDKMREIINKFKYLKATCEIVNQVKDFLLFKVIYNEIFRKDEEERFNRGIDKLNEIKIILNNSYTAYGNNFLNLLHRNFDRNLAEIVYEENKKIFDKTKIFLNTDESKIELFIAQMIKYFNIEEKNDLIKDLTIIFMSKKFEMDIKSIIFFFESFNQNDKEWNQTLSKDYETLSQL